MSVTQFPFPRSAMTDHALMKHHDRSLLRLCDANLNRAAEGLRVLEECARMLLNDALLTSSAKALRHDLAGIFRSDPQLDRSLPLARDTHMDVLKSGATVSENTRADLPSLVRANARRAAEAVRALEEYGKFISSEAAVAFKDIRFRVYDLEQQLTASLRHDSLLGSDRLSFGLIINAGNLATTVTEAVEGALRHGCGLIVMDGRGQSDRAFAGLVQEALEVAAGNLTVLVRSRMDIAIAAGADGVLLDDTNLSLSHCRAIGGQGMIIAYLMTEQDNAHSVPADTDLLVLLQGTGHKHSSGTDIGIPVIMHCESHETPVESGATGFLYDFPDVIGDKLETALGSMDRMCRQHTGTSQQTEKPPV